MKKYWKQIVGAAILVLVLFLVAKANNEKAAKLDMDKDESAIENQDKNILRGAVTAQFEGAHTLNYQFKLADGATTTLSKENRLVTVKSASTTAPIYFYFTYEGGRGYTPDQYIKDITSKYATIVKRETMTHGDSTWSVARSENSSWHVGSFGAWLVVVENANVDKAVATAYIESFKTDTSSKTVTSKMNMSDKTPDGMMKVMASSTATMTHEMN